MRPCRLLAVLMIAAAVAGCAHTVGPSAPPEAAAGPGDLDSIAYGRLGPGPAPVAVAAPPPAQMPEPALAPIPMIPAPIPASMVPVPVVAPAPMPEVMPVLLPTNEPYTLDSGDKLRITVYGQDGLSNTYIVDASGRITMPFIGPVSARGCTTSQLARVIADRLRNGFIREPHVAIEVETYRPFFILGEVLAPGQYPYVPNMTVETAVAIAGGYTPRAYRSNAEVSRSSGGLTARQTVPTIAPIRPGDTITVTERWF
jgi:polysaccharide export outer membrane protein